MTLVEEKITRDYDVDNHCNAVGHNDDHHHGNDNHDADNHCNDHNDADHHHDNENHALRVDDHYNESTPRYNFSEETDILVRAMPQNLCNKGFGVVQNVLTNEIFVSGQVYKITASKDSSVSNKIWVFIQALQLLDVGLESSMDRINFVFALYDNVMEFLNSKSTPGN